MDASQWIEGGVALAVGIAGGLLTFSFKAGALAKKVEDNEKTLKEHVTADNEHHKEEARQWQEMNRALGRIEGAMEIPQPRGPMRSRP